MAKETIFSLCFSNIPLTETSYSRKIFDCIKLYIISEGLQIFMVLQRAILALNSQIDLAAYK